MLTATEQIFASTVSLTKLLSQLQVSLEEYLVSCVGPEQLLVQLLSVTLPVWIFLQEE